MQHAAIYYCEHFEIIFNNVNKLDSEDALNIKNARKHLATLHVKNDLVYIKSNFSCFSTLITKLQTKGVSLADSIEIIDDFSVAMKRLTGNNRETYLYKDGKCIEEKC